MSCERPWAVVMWSNLRNSVWDRAVPAMDCGTIADRNKNADHQEMSKTGDRLLAPFVVKCGAM